MTIQVIRKSQATLSIAIFTVAGLTAILLARRLREDALREDVVLINALSEVVYLRGDCDDFYGFMSEELIAAIYRDADASGYESLRKKVQEIVTQDLTENAWGKTKMQQTGSGPVVLFEIECPAKNAGPPQTVSEAIDAYRFLAEGELSVPVALLGPAQKLPVHNAPHCAAMALLLVGRVRPVHSLLAPRPRGAARHLVNR